MVKHLIWLALAGNPWAGVDPDVRMTRVVSASPDVVVAALSDLDRARALFSDDCMRRWSVGAPSAGVGARATVTVTPGPMARRLVVEVEEVRPGARVVWDHLGPRGFFTYVDVEAVDGGTEVSVHTPLQPPPWPVRRTFHDRVKPAWAACWHDAVGGIQP